MPHFGVREWRAFYHKWPRPATEARIAAARTVGVRSRVAFPGRHGLLPKDGSTEVPGPTCTRLPRAADIGPVPAVWKIGLDPIGNSGPGRPTHCNSLRVVGAPKPPRRTGTGTRTTSDRMGPRQSANLGPARISVVTILLDPSGLTIPALSLNRCAPTLNGSASPYTGYRRRLHRLSGRHKMPVPRAGEHGAVS